MVDGIERRVEQSLDKVRPYLQRDGGDVELVRVGTNGVVHLRLTGSCETCPFSAMTMRNGIEEELRRNVPEVTEVIIDGQRY